MKITPLNGRCFALLIDKQEKLASGIELTDKTKERPILVEVTHVSKNSNVSIGDQVLVGRDYLEVHTVEMDGKEYIPIHEKDIYGVMN